MNTATSSIRVGLPRGPKGTLIGGNIHQFRARLLDFLLEAAREYGTLTGFGFGRRLFLFRCICIQEVENGCFKLLVCRFQHIQRVLLCL